LAKIFIPPAVPDASSAEALRSVVRRFGIGRG
jgi:hypothetical protein